MNKYVFILEKSVHRIFYNLFRPVYELLVKTFCKVQDNKYFFSSKPTYSDNAKYFCTYIEKEVNSNLQFVWTKAYLEKDPVTKNNYKWVVQYGKFNTIPLKTIKEYLTCKYVFFTHGMPIQPRKNQVVINLWHGCGYKDIEKRKEPWIKTFPFSYALVPGEVFIDTKTGFWGCDRNQIIPYGYPRYDAFLSNNKNAEDFTNQLKAGAEKLVVWMPTFRQTINPRYAEQKIKYAYDLPILTSESDLLKLNEFCASKKIMLCVKRHPMQKQYSCENQKLSNIKFISNDDFVKSCVDLYNFLKYTDSLISDYSSVAIDYILLDKPIGFSLDDFAEYKDARGFVFENPLDYMPGNKLYCYDDLLQFLMDVSENNDTFKAERDSLILKVHNPCENYCERIWAFVNSLK